MLALAQCGLVLCFLIWCVSRTLPRVDRLIALRESLQKPAVAATREATPLDLIAWARSYSSEWAREGALKTVEELYERHGNWDAVRASLPSDAGDS